MTQIERYILNELYILDQKAREGYNTFAFNRGRFLFFFFFRIKFRSSSNPLSFHSLVYQGLSSFSNITLSSFYYAVVKDALYTDSKSDIQRQKIIFTLRKVSRFLLFYHLILKC